MTGLCPQATPCTLHRRLQGLSIYLSLSISPLYPQSNEGLFLYSLAQNRHGPLGQTVACEDSGGGYVVSSRFLVHLFLSLSCPPSAEVAALPPPVYQPPACATPDHFEEPSWTPPLMIYIEDPHVPGWEPWNMNLPQSSPFPFPAFLLPYPGPQPPWSPTTPQSSATEVNFFRQSQMENLRLGVHNLFRSTDNGVAQLSILMTSFFLAQCNEKKKAIKIDDCYPLPFLPCTGLQMGPRIIKCLKGWRGWGSLYR